MPNPRFFHPHAIVETPNVGDGTRIWAFAHILPRAVIGSDCNICDHTFIENDVIIGDRVTIKSGVQLWDGLRVEDDVFIGPNATFTNDPFPRSRKHQSADALLRTTIRRGASIGANATVLPGLTIGEDAMIGAGSVVTHDVPRNAVVVGNPARISAYADAPCATGMDAVITGVVSSRPATVEGVVIYRLPGAMDLRGSLVHVTAREQVPFDVSRVFLVYGVPSTEVRGEHAHRRLQQFLICVHGSCHVMVDDGTRREEFALDNPTVGILVPPMVWSVQYKYSADAVLAVLASDPYDPADYIRSYDEFMALKTGTTRS